MTRICPDFARAYAEAYPERLREYVKDYAHAAVPFVPPDDTSRPFASDDLEIPTTRETACKN